MCAAAPDAPFNVYRKTGRERKAPHTVSSTAPIGFPPHIEDIRRRSIHQHIVRGTEPVLCETEPILGFETRSIVPTDKVCTLPDPNKMDSDLFYWYLIETARFRSLHSLPHL